MEWIIVELWLAFLKCSLPSTKESRSMRIYISWSKLGCPRWDIIWECQDKASFFLCCINGWSQNRNVQEVVAHELIIGARLEHSGNTYLGSCDHCRQRYGGENLPRGGANAQRNLIWLRGRCESCNWSPKVQVSMNEKWLDGDACCLRFVTRHFWVQNETHKLL